ncbi:PucR family transcriptional regulator ligand-binding domain-containing protein [Paenibacillus sp. TRM 82003]|nr:PucR family transcriptional regulator ligand-binding domain-containing protein [Paenibacillus sp. TRM 82003]
MERIEETNPGLVVRDVLRIPHFKDAVLLGGKAGLDKTVTRVNVMEVPDVIDWVRPGELLITTGYPFRQEPEVLETLVAQLADRGVAALGVKTKRFIDAVPESAVRAANKHGLPLIELPPSTTFSDVVREVMERVLVHESRQLSALQHRVQRLSHVLLHGGGLSAFLALLAELVGNPVALLDPTDRWTTTPEAESFFGRLSDETRRALRADRSRLLETSFVELDGRYRRAYCAEVNEGARPHVLLMVEADREYTIVDTLTLNWAGQFIGFEISNANARRKIEAKYVEQFIQDWIAGRIVSPTDLQLRAEACGCPLDERDAYAVGAVRFPERKPKAAELQELARRLNWEGGVAGVRWTTLEEELIFLLSGDRERTAGPDGWKEALASASGVLRSLAGSRPFQLCLGRTSARREDVSVSYREARRALEVGEVCGLKQDIVHYANLGTYLLLYRLLATEEAAEFRRNTLRPLLEYDSKNQNQGALVKTLKMYFECNGNVKETAERLFLHYNTVTYRLDRIKTELGVPLDDAETRLQLQLAIKLHEIKEA